MKRSVLTYDSLPLVSFAFLSFHISWLLCGHYMGLLLFRCSKAWHSIIFIAQNIIPVYLVFIPISCLASANTVWGWVQVWDLDICFIDSLHKSRVNIIHVVKCIGENSLAFPAKKETLWQDTVASKSPLELLRTVSWATFSNRDWILSLKLSSRGISKYNQ